MFIKNQVLGLTNKEARVRRSIDTGAQVVSRMGPSQKVTANISGLGLGSASSAGLSVTAFWGNYYQYFMTGLINDLEPESLKEFFRDIYLYDNVAGSAVDIQSTMPFSDWTLGGLDEDKLDKYNEALNRLNIRRMLPEISVAFLVDGFFASTLVYDGRAKQFLDSIIYDARMCTVTDTPFYNADPIISVQVNDQMRSFLVSNSVIAKQYKKYIPQPYIQMLMKGAFELNPVSSLFLARKTIQGRSYTSYLHRILPMYLIEKSLFRGTLVEVSKRQRAMSHIQVGDDTWIPTGEELAAYAMQFQMGEVDPMGAWISTRQGVSISDLRPAGEFLKWTDLSDQLTPYKLRALGISEAFLSGDTSFATGESAMSTFLETMDAYRENMSNRIFYTKLFPLIAVVNGFYKKDAKVKAQGSDVESYLYNSHNRSNLEIPELRWHKSLQAKDESNTMELLEKLEERGWPIALKRWAASAGEDPDKLIQELEEDTELRKKLSKYTGNDTSHDGEGDFGGEVDAALALPSRLSPPRRKPLLSRTFTDDSGDVYEFTKTGKKKYIYSQKEAKQKEHEMIAKIVARLHRDPEYREQLKKRNKEKGIK